MRQTETLNHYLTKTVLIGFFMAIGVATAATAVVALWTPLMSVASRCFA